MSDLVELKNIGEEINIGKESVVAGCAGCLACAMTKKIKKITGIGMIVTTCILTLINTVYPSNYNSIFSQPKIDCKVNSNKNDITLYR